jgi:hypothetical protein
MLLLHILGKLTVVTLQAQRLMLVHVITVESTQEERLSATMSPLPSTGIRLPVAKYLAAAASISTGCRTVPESFLKSRNILLDVTH